MSNQRPIGGYFGLDLPECPFPRDDAILLNSGRSCIEWVLRALDVRRVWLPAYTCDVVLEPILALGIEHRFLAIDTALELIDPPRLDEDEILIANNYFGLKDPYCAALAGRYGDQLIIDASQAFFAAAPAEAHSFYTPRKFFGVPDGACLYTDTSFAGSLPQDVSHQRSSHLMKRIDLGPGPGYADFQANDASLSGQGMRTMSALTRRLLHAIDYEAARERRRRNYDRLAKALDGRSELTFGLQESACPMVYPFMGDPALRAKLIGAEIFVATYWPNLFEWCTETDFEYRLARNLIPLPIDQRYGDDDMDRILEVIGC